MDKVRSKSNKDNPVKISIDEHEYENGKTAWTLAIGHYDNDGYYHNDFYEHYDTVLQVLSALVLEWYLK